MFRNGVRTTLKIPDSTDLGRLYGFAVVVVGAAVPTIVGYLAVATSHPTIASAVSACVSLGHLTNCLRWWAFVHKVY